jgi:methylmalonyl-CoA mutase C-terminal domain/subunit
LKKENVMAKTEKKIKVVIGKTSLDGHWRGVQSVAITLRNAGMEVVYVGMLSAETIVNVALQEDADVIGLNIAASYAQVEQLIKTLKKNQMEDIMVIVGGVIPAADISTLKEMGVHGVFPPGSKLKDIVERIHEYRKN